MATSYHQPGLMKKTVDENLADCWDDPLGTFRTLGRCKNDAHNHGPMDPRVT